MEPQFLRIRGARMHNLKNISADLPRNKLIVFTGLSGSGKSTLAFDTLYAEGQRRYVESLSTYARQFLGQMDKPDVDLLEGLSPAVSIEQKTTSKNPRSTVGTVTEIYDHLRLLFARAGQPHCPQCGQPIRSQSVHDILEALLNRPEGEKLLLLAPVIKHKKGQHEQVLQRLRKEGFVRARVDGEIRSLSEEIVLDKNKYHYIEAVVDRLVIKSSIRRRLDESVSTALTLSGGTLLAFFPDSDEEVLFSESAACHQCSISVPELSTQLFSFNNPQGACPVCSGLGVNQFIDERLIVPDPTLSLLDGAIAPWTRRRLSTQSHHWIEAFSRHYGFAPDTPFADLPAKARKALLQGTGREKLEFIHTRGRRTLVSQIAFEGIVPRLNRLFRETTSNRLRDEIEEFMTEQNCPACRGARLKPEALAVRVGRWSIIELCRLAIEQLVVELETLTFEPRQTVIATPILKEIRERLSFLQGVGLGYLSLDRKAGTLSGGEAQRIRLASQIGSGLAGVLYILDEPSIGLHQRDNNKLIKTLINLRNLGNTVIVVEHDSDTIANADHVLDIGPGAGVHGGEILYSGPVPGLLDCELSQTGGYLSGRLKIDVPAKRRPATKRAIEVRGATINNLQKLSVSFPLGLMTCVTGVSGSGKSSLVIETVFREAERYFADKKGYLRGPHVLHGLEQLDKVIDIDQSPIGRTPRSNPATYTGVMTPIRELLARLPESRARGYKPGRFSFNLKGGRCEACEGDGVLRIAMHFLPDIYVTCERCQGKRYNQETLDIRYKEKNIAEILQMTVEEALEFFQNVPPIAGRLQTIVDVGLGYLSLGQSSVTLSGGEAQRVKLAKELSRRSTGQTLYILDEPTTGLHPADIQHLLRVLDRLVSSGNTVVVIEHNLDVIKTADHVIDIGPEGGSGGGQVIATGTPEAVARIPDSYTGMFLKQFLNND
ncbi:excinuclease ABC subunit UvrA [Desulfobulbus oligotrophicus]|uniref:UvrABC system protein A n=1 Tax=Desulfobulbus oligotrophicus TaxID=1909699 RepID=A0A7T6APC4_9BACT|nr:excinuclease ABC subunit UvrA [Desulfobulbus oligotrophicus]QQG64566.1 excinuclease ABC subunit UvrA [Desulfobulbus oligotrophicus]